MRITYLYAKNVAGIKAGLGRNEIEIDFDRDYKGVPLAKPNKIVMLFGGNGSGKAQPNNSIIYTPDGYKLMGDIKVNDYVIDSNGNPTKVIGVFPQGKLDTFRVTFNDETFMDCNEDHLFKVMRLKYKRNKEKYWIEEVKSVKEILQSGLYTGNTLKYYIPMTEPVNFNKKEVFIHPYILGCLIGDGSLTTGNKIVFTNVDVNIINRFNSLLDKDYELSLKTNSVIDYTLVKKDRIKGKNNKYKDELIRLNLFNCKSNQKFIPDEYKFNSVNVRLEVLRGLMDTDGSIEKGSSFYYYTCSRQLADDIKFIVESLGGNAKIYLKDCKYTYKKQSKQGQQQYRIFIKLPSELEIITTQIKKDRYTKPTKYINPQRKIKSIESLNLKQEMTCIKVDNKDELYLTNNFIVTHNTTILSMLHPFADTNNDDRKSLILKDKQGIKEIHFKVDDDTFYVIIHLIKKTNKSFILKMNQNEYLAYRKTKDDTIGQNLNESGSVKNFKVIINDIFGIDEDYFKLLRIGSNVKNFIDLSTADRKKFITNFLPDIEEYLHYYSKISDKYKLINKEIKYLSDEIMKRGSKDELEADENFYITRVNTLKDDLKKANQDLAVIKNKIENLDQDGKLKENNFKNPYEKEYNLLKSKIVDEELIDNTEADLMKLEQTYKNREVKVQSNIKVFENKINSLEESIGKILENIEGYKNQINAMDFEDITYLDGLIEDYKLEIADIEEAIKELGELQYNTSDINENVLIRSASAISNLQEDLISTFNKCSSDVLTLIEMHYFERGLSLSEIKNNLDRNIEKCKKWQKVIDDTEREIISLESQYNNTAKIINLRPESCSDNTCPFIAKAIAMKDIPEKIEKLKIKINAYTKEIELGESVNEQETQVYDILRLLEASYKRYTSGLSDSNILKDMGIDNVKKYIKLLFKSPVEVKNKLNLSREVKYKNLQQELNKQQILLNVTVDKRKVMEDKLEFYNSINESMNNEKKKLSPLREKMTKIKNEYQDELEVLRKISAKLIQIENIKKFISIKDKYSAINKSLKEIYALVVELKQKDADRKVIKTDLETYEKKLESIKYEVLRLNEFNERKENLEKRFERISAIRDSLNPTKGIPVSFINNYLFKTRDTANELLQISQNGKFVIDFDVDSKDFLIKVYKANGDSLDDIRDASQGEVAVTSLSLSMALIEQTISDYLILYLDELDGPLDTNNRTSFINIVETQMNKLGIEQTFIISHNKEYENQEIDLILLKGYDFDTSDAVMSNKNIIFKA